MLGWSAQAHMCLTIHFLRTPQEALTMAWILLTLPRELNATRRGMLNLWVVSN